MNPVANPRKAGLGPPAFAAPRLVDPTQPGTIHSQSECLSGPRGGEAVVAGPRAGFVEGEAHGGR